MLRCHGEVRLISSTEAAFGSFSVVFWAGKSGKALSDKSAVRAAVLGSARLALHRAAGLVLVWPLVYLTTYLTFSPHTLA